MDKTHEIRVLNTLIETTIDSALGFEESAQEVESGRFASEFRRFAQERREVVEQLRARVRRLGGTPEDDGSVKGAAHRRWLNFKNAVTGASDEAVVQEVRNGETYLRGKYEAALEDNQLGPETRTAVMAAFESVRAGHERATALNDSGSGQ